jgi:undecaprenyl pyrophosphate phosphatase UppP
MRKRIERGFGRIQLAGSVLGLLLILIYAPIAGKYSFLTAVAIGAGAAFLIALDMRPDVFRGAEWLLAFAAASVAFLVTPARIGSIDFYRAAATVIPVLYLALAFQARAFSPERHGNEADRRFAIITAYILLVAGYQVFKALAEGRPTTADFNLVAAAMVGATAAIALPAVIGSDDPANDDRPEPD